MPRDYRVSRGGSPGEPAQWVAYVERGCFKYMVHNDDEGKDYCTGFAFEGEFFASKAA